MRKIDAGDITQAIARLCILANVDADKSICSAICAAREVETSAPAKNALGMIMENMAVAKAENMPLCQDTGLVVVFAEVGQDVQIIGSLEGAIQAGVRQGYRDGYFRASVVADPFNRTNTQDNTPAVIHYNIVPGDQVKLTVMPKGFGSENKSALKMLTPSEGLAGVEKFVLDTIQAAGSSPCPPIIVGIGIGGTFEKVALLAKEALNLDILENHPDPFYAEMEARLLEKINALEIGAAGFKGTTTALGVRILTYPTHIAGLPVAVNIGCHVARHKTEVL